MRCYHVRGGVANCMSAGAVGLGERNLTARVGGGKSILNLS